MITELNEKGHPMVFSDECVNTAQLKDKCIKAIESLSSVHGAAERKAEACFMIALSELENNWKRRAEAAEAKLAELAKRPPVGDFYEDGPGNWWQIGPHDKVPHVTPLFDRPAPAADLAIMCDRQYIAGLQAGFILGDAGDNEGLNRAIHNYRKQIIDSRTAATPAKSKVVD